MTTRDDEPSNEPRGGPNLEPERDAWLTAALRHAPDADAAPPAELSARILREARNAVKTPPAPARPNRLMQGWSWLARPPIAAGFATVMVATVVGLMWWDRPLDETLAPRGAPSAVTRPAEPAPSVAAAPAPAPPPRPAPTRAPARAAKREGAGEANTTADAANAGAATQGASRARDAAPATAAAAAMAEAEPRSAPAPAAAALAQRRQQAEPLHPLTIADPEAWTWQRGASPQPMTPALQAWLVQLDRAARWRPATSAPPPAAEPLNLARDGAPSAAITLGLDAVWLTRPGLPPLMAPLSPETAATLKDALIAVTP